MRVSIEEAKCCGFASCTSLAETVFEIRGDNVARVLDGSPGEELWPSVRAAAESCPTAAITVED